MMTLEEKLSVGRVQKLGAHTFTADEIIHFASRYDPQRFHLSEAEAAKTHFGRLCASGWHTAAVWMSRNVAADKVLALALRERGETPVEFGPAPGLRNVRWTLPVFAGDTISFVHIVLRDGSVSSVGFPEDTVYELELYCTAGAEVREGYGIAVHDGQLYSWIDQGPIDDPLS